MNRSAVQVSKEHQVPDRLDQQMPCPICRTMMTQDATKESYADQIRVWCDGCNFPLKVVVPLFLTDKYGWHWQVDNDRRTACIDLATRARRIVRWVVELFGDEWPDNGELSGAAIKDAAQDYLNRTDAPRGTRPGLSKGDHAFLDDLARRIDAGEQATQDDVYRLLAMHEKAV